MVPITNFPRADMNSNSNAQDILERRRRQIERTKAANLSKQLQMRLQYARLKVEHGWQKQSLNEVENLYFHHYRGIAPSGDVLKTASPKKDVSRQKNNVGLSADAANTDSSTRHLPRSHISMEVDSPTETYLQSSHSVTKGTPGVSNIDNSDSNSFLPLSEHTDEFTVLPASESYSSTTLSSHLLKNTSRPSGNSPASSNVSPPSRNLDALVPSNPLPEPDEHLTSSSTQVHQSVESTSEAQPKMLLSPSIVPSTSPSSTPTLTANRSKGKSTSTRSPSKLPIPRLPASSYPYTTATSSGKSRKLTSATAVSGTPKSVPSTLPSPPTAPLLSPYKPSHSVRPSSSTTIQSVPSAAGVSSNNTSLPLTYDSFWSSHTSSSSLPSSYRANVNVNLPSTSASSHPTVPSISSTLSDAPTLLAPTTSISISATTNFPFTSSISSSLKPTSSPIPPLSHSPIITSLLHPQGLPLFTQTRHSPTPVTTSQNQVG